jgi:hypothetical protein
MCQRERRSKRNRKSAPTKVGAQKQFGRHHAGLQEKMAFVKFAFKERIRFKDDIIEEMQADLAALKNVERQLALAHETIFKIRRDSGVETLEAKIESLKADLSRETTRAILAEKNLESARRIAESGAIMSANALQRIQALSGEIAALEAELRSSLACPEENHRCESAIENQGVNLCGRKIMYIGGRSSLVQYYRALVERRGGKFVYHDGGVESSMEMLKNTLTGADAVICPIDCVNHNACSCVKQACRHLAKPFVPLRSAGLSSLVHGLQKIA